MKSFILIITVILSVLFHPINISAQAPDQFKYQAILRNVNGQVISLENVSIEIHILKGSETGTVVYSETHNTKTTNRGLVTFFVGSAATGNGTLGDIQWATDSYFIKTIVDGTEMGTSPLLSVPYALYANNAVTAQSIEYSNVTNAPDVTTWDTDASDDFDGDYNALINKPDLFDGDYNSLTNKPQTITPEESAKLANITINSPASIDQIVADVAANKQRLSFPGFGTTEGLAIEGNTDLLWLMHSKDTPTSTYSNIYYPAKVGVNIPDGANMNIAGLHVGGGISFSGIPETNYAQIADIPGVLYYTAKDGGAFHYVNELNQNLILGEKINPESGLKDQIIEANTIIDGSLAVGMDAVNGESFGFNTLILKENNLRILFDDSDEAGDGMPYHDWKIEANESANGGTNHFAIVNETTTNVPFKIMGGAPNNAFRINADGNIGIGTADASSKLTVNGSIKADAFIGDGSGLTGITGGTGGIRNNDNTTIEADTNNDNIGEISFTTNGINRMTITNDGRVGIGTAAPSSELEVKGEATFQVLNVSKSISANSFSYKITETNSSEDAVTIDVTNKSIIRLKYTRDAIYDPNATGQEVVLEGLANGVEGQEITIITIAEGNPYNVLVKHNGSAPQKILLPGSANSIIENNGSIRLICDGNSWYRF